MKLSIRNTPHEWIILALLASASFATMAAFIRITVREIPQSEVIFFRNLIGFFLLIPVAYKKGCSLKTNFLGLHLLRAVVGIFAMYMFFYAIDKLSLSYAMLLNYTSPLFVSFFATIWLKEKVTKGRILSGILGLIGLLCLFQPTSSIASFAGGIGLLSGILAGLALTTVKKLSSTEPGLRIVILFSLLTSIFSVVPMLWDFKVPSGQVWFWLVAIGVFGTLGQLLLALAYQMAPASQVSPLGYSSLLFTGLIGFAFWGEIPDQWEAVGTSIIVIAGILVARERIVPMPTPPSATPEFATSLDAPDKI